jgi:hypothetical protein
MLRGVRGPRILVPGPTREFPLREIRHFVAAEMSKPFSVTRILPNLFK